MTVHQFALSGFSDDGVGGNSFLTVLLMNSTDGSFEGLGCAIVHFLPSFFLNIFHTILIMPTYITF